MSNDVPETATVKLRGKDIMLALPGYADRFDVYLALRGSTTAPNRIPAAALGLCWVGLHKPPVSYAGCSHDVGTFGGAIWDHLMAQGCNPLEVVDAGNQALRMCCAHLVRPEAIADAEAGFRGEPAPTGDL